MIASQSIVTSIRRRSGDEILELVPQRAFGDTAWVTLALKGCVDHLLPAIRSGRPDQIANAVRAITHAPTPEQLEDIVGAACDSALSRAYADRDTRVIANVADARRVIQMVIGELHERWERQAVAPALLRETVESYIKIVALLDQRLAVRLDAVGDLAARIGCELQLPAPAVLDIEMAGRLHDIGLLNGEAKESTPVAGETFLRSVPSLKHLAPIVRAYRERFDGTGYPDRLLADEIPLASRVIGVAATFVDLVTESPAHPAALADDACRELTRAAGTQFDPDVVAATLHLLRFRQHTKRSA